MEPKATTILVLFLAANLALSMLCAIVRAVRGKSVGVVLFFVFLPGLGIGLVIVRWVFFFRFDQVLIYPLHAYIIGSTNLKTPTVKDITNTITGKCLIRVTRQANLVPYNVSGWADFCPRLTTAMLSVRLLAY